MSEAAHKSEDKAVDGIQERLATYASALTYWDLPSDAIHATKMRFIDTLGVVIAGFFADSSRIARNVAAQTQCSDGSTVIGTRLKTHMDMAAFVNCTTARYAELTDSYHFPGSYGGHPSDVMTAVLAAGEKERVDGRQLITGIVTAYETYLRTNDYFSNLAFDHTIFCALGAACGTSKILGLTKGQLAHAISMAIVPNNALRVTRTGELTMWKVTASGQGARAGVFAAQLAQAGMEGPHLPFEGRAGWCDHVALKRFQIGEMGGQGVPFKITQTNIKLRPSVGLGIAPILAAEKVAPINPRDVKEVIVEAFKKSKDYIGTAPELWHPESKETADHSAPYLVAATLMDGTITMRSYNEAHLRNPELHALMQKIKVVENPEFTEAYGRREQRARVTVITTKGEKLVGDATGDKDAPSAPKTDDQINKKFRDLTEDVLGAKRVTSILDRLWHLEEMKNVAEIPPYFVLT